MNNKLVTALLTACLPFSLIIIGEWLYGQHSREAALQPKPTANKTAVPTTMPSVDLTKLPEESYEQMVSRPLFMKGRRPVAESNTAQAEAEMLQANFDWQLDGIYTTPKGSYILLSRAKGKKPRDNYRKITLGGTVEGWKLEEIDASKAVFSVAGEKKQLMLKKPKPKMPNRPESNPGDPTGTGGIAPPEQIIPPVPPIPPDNEPPIDDLNENSPVNAPNE